MEHILISGFADEISPDFDEQLRVVTSLGMEYISLRTADGKGIADYTAEEVEEKLLPRLRESNVINPISNYSTFIYLLIS